MLPTVRKDYIIASNLYFIALAMNMVINFYSFFKSIVPFITTSNDPILRFVILCIAFILPILLAWLGFGIRTGKSWATVLFLVYFAWQVIFVVWHFPNILSNISYWGALRNLLSVSLFIGITYFLFRHNFIRRSAA